MVPNDYQVFLNPRDFAPYSSFAGPLVRQLEDALRERSRELGAALPGPLRVTLGAREEITPGQLYVETRLVPGPETQSAGASEAGSRGADGGTSRESGILNPDTRVYRRQPGAPRIRIEAGPPGTAGREFGLNRPVTTIGRRGDQDIVLADPSVSRAHARIEVTAEDTSIVDLNSTNGTLVNGHPVGTSRAALHPGDRIQIGTVLLEFLGGT